MLVACRLAGLSAIEGQYAGVDACAQILTASRPCAAKARGQALGNPRLAEARAIANAAHKAGADAHTAIVAPVIAEAQAAGAKSLRQIAAALNARGIATARGGKWEAQTVANIMRRA